MINSINNQKIDFPKNVTSPKKSLYPTIFKLFLFLSSLQKLTEGCKISTNSLTIPTLANVTLNSGNTPKISLYFVFPNSTCEEGFQNTPAYANLMFNTGNEACPYLTSKQENTKFGPNALTFVLPYEGQEILCNVLFKAETYEGSFSENAWNNTLIPYVNDQLNIYSFPPSSNPTTSPTSIPSSKPTHEPTSLSTHYPSSIPTTATPTYSGATQSPTTTNRPSSFPTAEPSNEPTFIPSQNPTSWPTSIPTTNRPTGKPTGKPSSTPTSMPTVENITGSSSGRAGLRDDELKKIFIAVCVFGGFYAIYSCFGEEIKEKLKEKCFPNKKDENIYENLAQIDHEANLNIYRKKAQLILSSEQNPEEKHKELQDAKDDFFINEEMFKTQIKKEETENKSLLLKSFFSLFKAKPQEKEDFGIEFTESHEETTSAIHSL